VPTSVAQGSKRGTGRRKLPKTLEADMHIRTRAGLLALVVAVTMALPRGAEAEPIRITSGHVAAEVVIGSARMVVNGDGFALDAFVEAYSSVLSLACTPCAPGTTVSLGGSFEGPRAAGTAFVDGVAYSEIFLDGMTGTFSSPSFEISGTQNVTIVRPFTFSGTLSGYVLNPFVHGFTEPAFTKTLSGRGTAKATFLFNDTETPLFFAEDLRYDFAGDAAPVPEPATLLLFGTGATIAALLRRRRSSRWR
jgi:hypothetical protein